MNLPLTLVTTALPGEQPEKVITLYERARLSVNCALAELRAGNRSRETIVRLHRGTNFVAGACALATEAELTRDELQQLLDIAVVNGIALYHAGDALKAIDGAKPMHPAAPHPALLMPRPECPCVMPPTTAPGAQPLFGVLMPLAGRPVTIAEIDSHLVGIGYDQADCPTIRERLATRGFLHSDAEGRHTLTDSQEHPQEAVS